MALETAVKISFRDHLKKYGLDVFSAGIMERQVWPGGITTGSTGVFCQAPKCRNDNIHVQKCRNIFINLFDILSQNKNNRFISIKIKIQICLNLKKKDKNSLNFAIIPFRGIFHSFFSQLGTPNANTP